MVPLLDVFDYKLVKTLYAYSNKLQNATKKADKTKLLQQAKDDKDLKYFLDFVLNPRIVTGLSDKKINQLVRLDVEWDTDFYGICNYLKKHNSGRNEDIAVVKHYLNQFDGDIKEFLVRVFTKNLPLGVEVKTVNKALGFTLIPDWQVQQAYLIEKYPIKDGEWFAISQKMNGTHCSWMRGEMISRQGTQFTGLEHITDEIRSVVENPDDWFLDGELIRKNTDGVSDGENFRIGTGLANAKDADKTSLEYVIYDMLPAAEFDSGKSKLNYRERLYQLNAMDNLIREKGCQHIRIVPRFYNGKDTKMIAEWLDYAVAHNMEGCMVNLNVPYRCTRHNGILKVKRFYTMDLPIIAVEEGSNRLAGTLGALVVDYKGNEVRVGSGFDDATRKKVWDVPDMYVGKLAEIQYKESSRDKKTGKESLQFPTFKQFRFDKDDVSFD